MRKLFPLLLLTMLSNMVLGQDHSHSHDDAELVTCLNEKTQLTKNHLLKQSNAQEFEAIYHISIEDFLRINPVYMDAMFSEIGGLLCENKLGEEEIKSRAFQFIGSNEGNLLFEKLNRPDGEESFGKYVYKGDPSSVVFSKAAGEPCTNADFSDNNYTGWETLKGTTNGTAYTIIGPTLYTPSGNDHHMIFTGGTDPVVPSIPCVNPLGPVGGASVRIGDGTGNGAKGAILRQTFLVSQASSAFSYSYAAVLQDPGHPPSAQPFFKAVIFDENGTPISCGQYQSYAGDGQYDWVDMGSYWYKNWSTAFVDLSSYIGQNITIELTAGDCSYTGHYGYAYVQAECTSLQLELNSEAICNGQPVTLTAPSSAQYYQWNTGQNTQSIVVTIPGTYSVNLTPNNQVGTGCELNLTVIVPAAQTPTADFSFVNPTLCVNDSIFFTDNSIVPGSDTLSSVSWNFGDGISVPGGLGNISGVNQTGGTHTDPTHIYSSYGNHTVTMTIVTEFGCVDTHSETIQLLFSPNVNAINDITICQGNQVTLNATGAVTYTWNNGAPHNTAFTPPLGQTMYAVTGIGPTGCSDSDSILVTVTPGPAISAGLDVAICDGESVTLSASTSNPTFSWSNGVVDNVPFTPSTSGYYVATASLAGCTGEDSLYLTVNPNPVVIAGNDLTICEGNQATLTASGANTYSWSNGAPHNTAFTPPLGQTMYVVTGVDPSGCSHTDSMSVTVAPEPTISAGPDVAICDGESVTLSASTSNPTLSWNNGVVDNVPFTPSTSGYYVATASLAGCTGEDSLYVTVNPNPVVIAGNDLTICEGNQATLTASGANTYSWSNGAPHNTAFTPPLGQTMYVVTGVDPSGCSHTDSMLVTVAPEPTVSAGSDVAICNGETVTLSASTSNPTLSWNNGVVDNVPFTPSTSGYYVATASLAGCTGEDSLYVTVNPNPVVIAGNDLTICEGNQATLTASGANTYSWSNGAPHNTAFTPPLGQTMYVVTGVDPSGCSHTDSMSVTVAPEPTISAGLDVTICDGESVTLSASTSNPTLSWNNGVVDNVPFTPSTSGYYVATASLSGCMGEDSLYVTVNPTPVVIAGNDLTICEGNQATLTASGANTYSWSNGAPHNTAFTPPLGQTMYVVTGVDPSGCSHTDSMSVTVAPEPTISAGLDVTICDGESVTLSASTSNPTLSWNNGVVDNVPFTPSTSGYYVATASMAGCMGEDSLYVTVNPNPVVIAGNDITLCEGNQATLTANGAGSYSWSNGAPNNTAFTPPLGQTMYVVTGVGPSGCSASDSTLVTVSAQPTISAGLDVTICDGESVTLSASTSNPTLSWSNGVVDNVPFTPSTSGYYVATASLAGCMGEDSLYVTVNPNPIVIAGNDISLCEGNQATLTASGAGSYSWSNGAPHNTAFTPPLGQTMYVVTGVDPSGCSASDSTLVTVSAQPTISAGLDVTICDGESVTLSASTSNPTLSWSNGVVDNVPFTPSTSGYYVATASLAGCMGEDSLYVTVNPNPIVIAGNDISLCEGNQATLTASGAGSYSWSNGAPHNTAFTPPLGQTMYVVTGVDPSGCSASDSTLVTVTAVPTINAGADVTICQGESVTLSASSSNSTISWSNGVLNNVPFIPASSGYYFATASNSNCFGEDSVYINITPNPVVNAGNDITVCEGSSFTLQAGGNATNYVWSNNASNNTPISLPAGTYLYTVTGTFASGCSSQDDISITVNPGPAVSAGADQSICVGESVTLTASGSASPFSWNNNVQDGVAFSPTQTLQYIVETQVVNGCSGFDTVVVNVNELPVINLEDSLIFCDNEPVVLSANSTGTAVWNNSVQDGVPFTLSPGNYSYTVIVTDANNCSQSAAIQVSVAEAAYAEFTADSLSGCSPLAVEFTNVSQNATSYYWDFGNGNTELVNDLSSMNQVFENSSWVQLVASNGNEVCNDTMAILIQLIDCGSDHKDPTVTVPNVFTVNNDGVNDLFFLTTKNAEYIQFIILNRWGNLIYDGEGDEINPPTWDGKDQTGKDVSEGVYFYKYIVKGAEETTLTGHGSVTVIK